MTKKTRNRLIVIIALLVIAVFITHKILTWDEPPFDDSDLALEYLDIPDDENALTYFNEAARLLAANGKDYDDFVNQLYPTMKVYDPEFSEGFLQKNHKAFETFKRGLEYKHCQGPRIVSPFPSLDLIQLRRQMARALSVRAMHFQKQGKEEEAIEAAMDIVKFGHMLENSRASLIHHVVGQGIKSMGLSRLRKTITVADVEPELLKRCIREMGRYKSNEEGLVNAMKAEYMVDCMFVDFTTRRDQTSPLARIRHSYTFKPNETKRMYADTYRFFIDKVSEPWSVTAQIKESDMSDDEAMARLANPIRPNEIGKILNDGKRSFLKVTIQANLRERVSVSATQLLFALKCYKLEHGDLPDSLDELVPEYIDKIPIDHFDGKHLRYSKENRIIYSVGPDMEDDGGPTKDRIEKSRKYTGPFWNHKDPWVAIGF